MVIRRIGRTEGQEQAALFEWAEVNRRKYPELATMYAIPNGANKSMATAMKFKREGLRAGVPDICLPVARGQFHALYLEMKRKGVRPSAEQTDFMFRLTSQGNKCVVCFSQEDAVDAIREYLKSCP